MCSRYLIVDGTFEALEEGFLEILDEEGEDFFLPLLNLRAKGESPGMPVFKATVGPSGLSLSGAGHLGQYTTYLFSARQSYLQLLFKALGLPFLPNFIDGQFKTKTRFNEHSELTLLGLAGIDKMKLNTDEKGEDAEYLLSYPPTIHQETFTLGAP